MDWKTFIVEFLKALTWPGTVLVILFALRKTIARKLEDLIEIHREGESIKALIATPHQAGATLPSPGQTILSQEEVREALKRICNITIRKRLIEFFTYLRARLQVEAQVPGHAVKGAQSFPNNLKIC